MPAADLPSLETRLEACLIELERLYEARPRMSDALARAAAGHRIDELLDEIAVLQQEIMLSPAVTLQDAAVKLRRLSVYLEGPEAARLLEGALEAVERTAGAQPLPKRRSPRKRQSMPSKWTARPSCSPS